jgi:hypothetical protein
MFVDLAAAGSMCKVQQYQIIKIIRCDYSRWWLQHTKARLYRQNISPALDFTGLQAYYSILQCDSIKLQSQWWHLGPTAGSNVTQIDLWRSTYFGWALPPKTFFLMCLLCVYIYLFVRGCIDRYANMIHNEQQIIAVPEVTQVFLTSPLGDLIQTPILLLILHCPWTDTIPPSLLLAPHAQYQEEIQGL